VAELRQALDEEWAAFKQQNLLFHQQQVCSDFIWITVALE